MHPFALPQQRSQGGRADAPLTGGPCGLVQLRTAPPRRVAKAAVPSWPACAHGAAQAKKPK
jgi:hypothetical protein